MGFFNSHLHLPDFYLLLSCIRILLENVSSGDFLPVLRKKLYRELLPDSLPDTR
jgi:hypothetical protein